MSYRYVTIFCKNWKDRVLKKCENYDFQKLIIGTFFCIVTLKLLQTNNVFGNTEMWGYECTS